MSFRYTNYMIGMFKQRIVLHRALSTIMLRNYIGRDGSGSGVQVECNAYGTILSITVGDNDGTSSEQQQQNNNTFVDPKTGIVDAEPLAAAIRSALFDANVKIRRDKEEAFRESIRAAPELLKNDHYERWYSANGSSLPPFCYHSLRDEPAIEAMKNTRSATSSASSSSSGSDSSSSEDSKKQSSSPSSSIFGEIRAETNESMAAVVPELAGAFLQLEDPLLIAEKRQMRLDDAEGAFWQRVDLIRRAQVNTIGTRKRKYEEFESASKSTELEEKVKLSFVK